VGVPDILWRRDVGDVVWLTLLKTIAGLAALAVLSVVVFAVVGALVAGARELKGRKRNDG